MSTNDYNHSPTNDSLIVIGMLWYLRSYVQCLTSWSSCSSVVCCSVMSNGKVSCVESLIRATIFLRVSVATGQNGAHE